MKEDQAIISSRFGLREQNKFEKRQRIRAAARVLFCNKGYEAATVRQIAHLARVGLGTLFSYAQDKRDLVFLVFNEELDALADEALRVPQDNQSLLDQIIAIFKNHYEYFAKEPRLSRIILKELVFYSEGKQAATFHAICERLVGGIEKAVRTAQQKGRIHTTENSAFIARCMFFVCASAIRSWIAQPKPNPSEGLTDLGKMLQLQIDGLRPVQKTQRKSLARPTPKPHAIGKDHPEKVRGIRRRAN